MTRIYLLTIISCCLQSFCSTGQVLKSDTVKREAQITYSLDENQAVFSAITPPLQEIQGAPTAFYTFYWEFGDGHTAPTRSRSISIRKQANIKFSCGQPI